ncbi:phosphoglycerate dehydrogenase [Bacillus mesophilum]|uniref:Phosphoglycerate dehydrogenase n=1 Tax=Bacillus mesophilum TaxID=1071718 RepID=A0A7V7UX64_9BACI|nr:phosphoglycerate dehydrogenase [Bacillus mesophilum]KAB2335661.1 phosphoglycerate dehydrogenase [Bacillus mesophilum]
MNALILIRDAFVAAYPELIEETEKLCTNVTVMKTDDGVRKEDLLKEAAAADIIVVAVVKIDRDVIDAAKNLKYIIKFGAGYDNIDVAYAEEKGIIVSNAPGQNADSAADLAFGLMLASSRSISQKDAEVKARLWNNTLGNEVHNKKLGIVGFGSIGQAIAKRANGFSMDVMAYGNYQNEDAAAQLNVRFTDLDTLLTESDYVILSTSLTSINKHFINRDTLGRMKSSAFLINISRGGLINEVDLVEALKSGGIRGAALDVFEVEPPQNELSLLPNVIATPHIGGATYEAIVNISTITIDNIQRFIAEEELLFVVH